MVVEEVQKMKMKEAKIQNEINLLSSPNVKVFDVEKKIFKIYDEIRILKDDKDRKMKRFTLLREHISINLSTIEGKLEECLSTKTSFQKFSYENLQACEIASYGLCALLSVVD